MSDLLLNSCWTLRSWGNHTSAESAGALAGLVARKPTLCRLCLGEMALDGTRQREVDPIVVAGAVLTWGLNISAVPGRIAQTGVNGNNFG